MQGLKVRRGIEDITHVDYGNSFVSHYSMYSCSQSQTHIQITLFHLRKAAHPYEPVLSPLHFSIERPELPEAGSD